MAMVEPQPEPTSPPPARKPRQRRPKEVVAAERAARAERQAQREARAAARRAKVERTRDQVLAGRRALAAADQQERAQLERRTDRLRALRADAPWPRLAETGERAQVDVEGQRHRRRGIESHLVQAGIVPAGPLPAAEYPMRGGQPVPGALDKDAAAHALSQVRRMRGEIYRPPPQWTREHVEQRLVEAFEILFRLPIQTRPGGFRTSMPAYQHEFSDLVEQRTNKDFRRTRQRLLLKGGVTQDENRRMEQAIQWPTSYLSDNAFLARITLLAALWKVQGRVIADACKEIGVWRSDFYETKRAALERIKEGLVLAGLKVT